MIWPVYDRYLPRQLAIKHKMPLVKNLSCVFLCILASPYSLNAQAPKSQPRVIHFIPTSELVRVATMAARDEGNNPSGEGIYLDELRTADCKNPIPGYESIALYQNGHPVESYAVRVDTGDVVEPDTCTLLQYPDLMKFRQETTAGFKTKGVTPDTIAAEVGCDKLKTASRSHGQ